MKIKELITELTKCEQEKEILLSCDEELNTLFRNIEVCILEDEDKYCLYGLSGSEVLE